MRSTDGIFCHRAIDGKLTYLGCGLSWPAGAAIGLIAALISILTEWLASIKLGYCTSGWWLKEKFCCLGADDGADGSTCADYHEWGGGGPVAWFVYVTCAVSYPFGGLQPAI